MERFYPQTPTLLARSRDPGPLGDRLGVFTLDASGGHGIGVAARALWAGALCDTSRFTAGHNERTSTSSVSTTRIVRLTSEKAKETMDPTNTAPVQNGRPRGMGGATSRSARVGRRFHPPSRSR